MNTAPTVATIKLVSSFSEPARAAYGVAAENCVPVKSWAAIMEPFDKQGVTGYERS